VPPLTYDPGRFHVTSFDEAANIILTPETSTTKARWDTETPYFLDLIGRCCQIGSQALVLDYGCGIGRLSKGLIERHGCRVVGADISATMRAHAELYVNDSRFLACAPEALDWLGLRFDAAISVWVLQHCLRPHDDIARIKARLAPNAPLFIANNDYRAVPTKEQPWANDGVDIAAELDARFVREKRERIPAEIIPASLADITYWGLWRNVSGNP
jgi:SAM-dependent methyltransferase